MGYRDEVRKPTIDTRYIKSIGIDKPDEFFADVVAVKSLGGDNIRGYMALWGNPERVDVESDYFTKSTDFWLDRLQGTRPLTWDHAQDSKTAGDPVIGTIHEIGADDTGLWYTAQLDRAHKYRKAIDKLIAARSIGTSSDSAPQYVQRERVKSANWLKRWPLFAGALTTTPAEPRMIATVDYFKSIGITVPDEPQAEAMQEALRDWQARYEILYRREQLLKLYY